MKQILYWLKTNKPKVSAVLLLTLTFITSKGYIDTPTAVFLGGVLIALGLGVAKDASKHSSSIEVSKADNARRELL